MIGRYSASRSMRMHRIPSARAATPVVPDPPNGSSTVPPGGVMRRMHHRMRSTGFTVGWVFAGPWPLLRSAVLAFAV